VTRSDSNDTQPLRRKAQAREALIEFAETSTGETDNTQAAFAQARGAESRAHSREIGLLRLAAHILLLAFSLSAFGAGMVYFSVRSWLSGVARTRFFVLDSSSSQAPFYLLTIIPALLGVAALFTAIYFFSRLGASHRERQRFARGLPKALRPARASLLIAIWLVCAAVLVWSLSGP
jgi:hypothetical protein